MSKTKIVVKNDQILVDLEWIFQEIRDAQGNWEAVETQLLSLLDTVKEE